ncbi:MAG: hypothetical protein ACREJ3_06665, partial [Polyangiaceae bacterium]
MWIASGVVVAAAGMLWRSRPAPSDHREASVAPAPITPATASSSFLPPSAPQGASDDDDSQGDDDGASAHDFRVPGGESPALTCAAARAIVSQVRSQLAYVPEPVDAKSFGEAVADWLDPFGLWSMAPDAVVADALDRRAAALVADLEGRGSRRCDTARALGAAIVPWIDHLRAIYDDASAHAKSGDAALDESAPAFEGSTVTRPAGELAALLGHRVGAIARDLGPAAHPYVDAARARYFPGLDESGWAGVVL